MKQVKFVELEAPNEFLGGILLDNGDVICGCCGGLFESKERGKTWDIILEFDDWVSLSEEIIWD